MPKKCTTAAHTALNSTSSIHVNSQLDYTYEKGKQNLAQYYHRHEINRILFYT